MEYCVPRGIPHSEFLKWDADDRWKALTWQGLQSQRCSECGTRPDEWNPEHGGNRQAYRAEVGRCRGCQVLQQGQESLSADPERGRGTYVYLKKNEEVTRGR